MSEKTEFHTKKEKRSYQKFESILSLDLICAFKKEEEAITKFNLENNPLKKYQ